MDKKLIIRVLEITGKHKGSDIGYDPLIREGHSIRQVTEAVEYCRQG